MLIRFSVKNFLSFKEMATIDMLPSSISQHKKNLLKAGNYKLLKCASIFGANASGKSNFFKAMGFVKNFIINSSKETQVTEEIPVKPFLFSDQKEEEPSIFEFIFIKNNIKYRYGFGINKNEVVEEWLYSASKNKEKMLFERSYQDIKVDEQITEGEQIKKLTRKNALFLSVAAQFNDITAQTIIDWFKNFNVISGLQEYKPITLDYLKNKKAKEDVVKLLKIADSTINDISFEELPAKMPEEFLESTKIAKSIGINFKILPKIKTLHNKYDLEHNVIEQVEMDFRKTESTGTQNLFSMLGPILDTIDNGKVLVIDELECNMHPLITRFLVRYFHSKNNSAQFIFNTHDTNLLSNKYFRRDQIYFMNKNRFGESKLYSLYDYNVRYDSSFGKDYLKGRYRAIPFIDEYGFFGDELNC